MLQKSPGDRTPPNFFSSLGDKDRIRLCNIGTTRTVAESELLFKKGSPEKTIYCVLSGAFVVESRDPDAPGCRFKPGDLIGETGLSSVEVLRQQKDSAQLREAALTRYIKKIRKPLAKYEQSEIIVNIVKNIPRLPLHITHLIELLAGRRASAKEVAALAKQDPSLVVDILKTIPDSDEFREVYRHSLFLSCVASELCQSYDKNRAALLGTIGLLHDIGETVVLLLQKQNPKWSLFIEMLDPSRLGAMLLRQWNIPKQIWQTIEYQAYPAFCHPLEVPSDLRVNIALLYVAHAACDYLNHGAVGAFDDHPYLDRYLRLLRLDSRGIDHIAKQNILQGLMAKYHRLPDFVQKRLALSRISENI